MGIIEQAKELRNIAETFCEWEYNRFYDAITRAVDTIEALSAKMAVGNMQQSESYYNSQWVPVSQPTKTRKDVLVQYKSGRMDVGWCDKQGHWWTSIGLIPVVWRPLPEPYHEP